MTHAEFRRLVKERQKHTNTVLIDKAKEYAMNGDRLHNFNRAAAMNNVTTAQALWGMLTKHIVSVKDMVDNTANNIYPTDDQINEKIGDIINYMHLLEAVFISGRK